MRRGTLFAAVLLTLVGLGFTGQNVTRDDFSTVPKILAFDTMFGVSGAFVGDANPIRGIVGDESPWVIAKSIHGFLDVNGRVRIRVRGLVFGNDPSVPPDLVGKNDEETFRATVSCLTEDAAGNVTTDNLTTMGFPATTRGNSDIDATLALPKPCVAPIVMVLAGSEDKWFAVTGQETAPTRSDDRDRFDGHR